MREYTYNFGCDDSRLVSELNGLIAQETSTSMQAPFTASLDWHNTPFEVDDANYECKYLVNNTTYIYGGRYQAKITPHSGVRACYGLYKAKERVRGVETGRTLDTLVLFANVTSVTGNFDIVQSSASVQNNARIDLTKNGVPNYSHDGGVYNWRYTTNPTYDFSLNNLKTATPAQITYMSTASGADDDIQGYLGMIQSGCDSVGVGFDVNNTTTYPRLFAFANIRTWHGSSDYATVYTINKLPFPVYDLSDVTSIINYLNNGEDGKQIDPLDPTPTVDYITDFNTNYRVFVSAYEGDKTQTKFSVIAYNSQNIAHSNDFTRDYKLYLTDVEPDATTGRNIGTNATNTAYPTVGYYRTIPNTAGHTVPYGLSMRFNEVGDDRLLNLFTVYFQKSTASATNCTVYTAVYQDEDIYTEYCTRSNVKDGYRFTNSRGYWVDVLFRAPDITDLNDKYIDDDDNEDDTTGGDTTFSGANGLHTYAIDNNDFDVINKKLWSTDWSTVFKSTTIDPVKCVISCKSIPFTADTVSSANLTIANMTTGLTKNYVKVVKSFNVGSVLMPHYRDDFTDISMTHIRCYLPFIGWVELPASECMSRVAYNDVGISAKPKRLKFKYIVDFVDGSVRCVVSVNDTERWFFDGNCACDVPVTSDNHTQAISNSIRSGVSTGLSIISAVTGAYTGSAGAIAGGLIGATQNAPNMYPTYSYTATANGSGYITASMNTHIMIVIERPNVQMPNDYAKRLGRPCNLSLPLSSISGFTKCSNVDLSGINATPNELSMIKALLESGVYL